VSKFLEKENIEAKAQFANKNKEDVVLKDETEVST
jgi:hypothetical protein